MSLPAVVQCALRVGCMLPAVCKELRDAARDELRCAELAAVWALERRPSAGLVALMRDAAASERTDVVGALVRLPELSEQWREALIDFACSGDLHMCEAILTASGGGPAICCGALHTATQEGHVEVCKLLLANGATTTGVGSDGAMHAAMRLRNVECCRILLRDGLDACTRSSKWDECWFTVVVRQIVDWDDDKEILKAAVEIFHPRFEN